MSGVHKQNKKTIKKTELYLIFLWEQFLQRQCLEVIHTRFGDYIMAEGTVTRTTEDGNSI